MDSDKVRLSAKAGLKTIEKQMEDQRQKLYTTEINLATKNQTVLDLKAELQKAKEAARVAKEAAKAAVNTSYERGVLDMETCLAEEVCSTPAAAGPMATAGWARCRCSCSSAWSP